MAGVIKSGSTTVQPGAAAVVSYNFDDIATKANEYLESVKEQGARIVASAQEQAAKIQAQAEASGKHAALEAAKKLVHAEFDQKVSTLLPALRTAIQAIQDERQAWVRRWESSAIRLAAAIAKRIIRRELSAHGEDITSDWIREALQLCGSNNRIRLLLNPDDFRTLEGKSQSLIDELGRLAPAEVVSDPSVPKGGCRVVTEYGEIDQSMEAQLRRIEAELIDAEL